MQEPLKLAYLTAGAAGMFCGSCMRDNSLAAALMRQHVDVHLLPLYTPIRTDEENVSDDTVFFGGINVYLQQHYRLFRYLPRWLDRWLDQPGLIRRLANGRLKVNGHDLGEMAVSVLRGTHGHQRKEVFRLVDYLADQLRPHVIDFTNVLITGCLPELKKRLDVPVFVTLQGDDLFLADLPTAYREAALKEIRRLSQYVDHYITFSRNYADSMARFLGIPREKFLLVPIGVNAKEFAEPRPAVSRPDQPLTVGYFARICPAKGFHLLVDAFIKLRTMPGMQDVRLRAAGWLGESDNEYYHQQRGRIVGAGLADAFTYDGVVDRAGKVKFFQEVDLVSVPTTYEEPKGLFVLESLASGVPVVQPAHGAFPELLEATGGGRLFRPNDTNDLAVALREMLLSRDDEAIERVRATVMRDFTSDAMAARTLAHYRDAVSRRQQPAESLRLQSVS